MSDIHLKSLQLKNMHNDVANMLYQKQVKNNQLTKHVHHMMCATNFSCKGLSTCVRFWIQIANDSSVHDLHTFRISIIPWTPACQHFSGKND
jgi:hypothetical protein